MPDGAAVVKYNGKRGVVWRIKFRDATGRQADDGNSGQGGRGLDEAEGGGREVARVLVEV